MEHVLSRAQLAHLYDCTFVLYYMQLSKLCAHLDQLWSDGAGSVILYTWQQFLAAETLPLLGVGQDNNYLLTIEDPNTSKPDWDPRAVQGTVQLRVCTVHVQ